MKTKIIIATLILMPLIAQAESTTTYNGGPRIKLDGREGGQMNIDVNGIRLEARDAMQKLKIQAGDTRLELNNMREERNDDMRENRELKLKEMLNASGTASGTRARDGEMRDGRDDRMKMMMNATVTASGTKDRLGFLSDIRMQAKEKREQIVSEYKEKRKAVKESVKADVKENLNQITAKLQAADDKLLEVINNAKSAIDAKKLAGINTTKAEAQLSKVMQVQSEVVLNIQAVGSLLKEIDGTGANKAEIKAQVNLTTDSLKELKQEVRNLLVEIKNL